MTVVAGIDSSTQSCTVVLRDADTGAVRGIGRAPHVPTFPPVSEQDPEDWWQALIAAFALARNAASVRPNEIVAVSVAAQCHGLVPIDASGAVIRPAKLWNDTTSSPQNAALLDTIGSENWLELVGSLPSAAFTASKLLWLKENEPTNFARINRVLLPHDYLTWRLTGEAVTDRSEASGTGYYSAVEARYLPEVLSHLDADLDWDSVLPTVLGPDTAAGTIRESAAAELGINPRAVVGAGAGDQHASALGLGVVPGDVVYVFGTSGVVFATSPTPVLDRTGDVNSVADAAGGYLPLVCTLNAAKVTDTVARLLGIDHIELERLALASPRRADRPVFAAYIDGERSPNRPNARGLLGGISGETGREDLALAAVEGVVFGLERGHDALRNAGIRDDGRLLITGGGAASAAYRQVLSDLLGRRVELADQPEATASGAAVQAAAVLRGSAITTVRDAWAPATTVVAEPTAHDYTAVRHRYRTLADWTGQDSIQTGG